MEYTVKVWRFHVEKYDGVIDHKAERWGLWLKFSDGRELLFPWHGASKVEIIYG